MQEGSGDILLEDVNFLPHNSTPNTLTANEYNDHPSHVTDDSYKDDGDDAGDPEVYCL